MSDPAAGSSPRAALVVFAKAPVSGRVKTRLSPPLAPDEAAGLYAAFLADALDGYTRPGAFGLDETPSVRLHLDGDAALLGDVPPGVSLHAQHGDGLGARMLRAFVEAFAAGFSSVVVIGTDHPTLPLAFVGEAFRSLAARPLTAVLGPSDDGGYYLLGLNDLAPALFEGMAYSHAGVFEETLRRASGAGLAPVVLPPWYDVDTAEELTRLVAEGRSGADVPPRTAAALEVLVAAHPELAPPTFLR